MVVDDFGIKYHSKNDAFHLLSCLRELYEIITDWSESLYIGFTLKLNYSKQNWVELSIPGYIERALTRFCLPLPVRPQHSPHEWSVPSYGAKIQLSKLSNTSTPLPLGSKERIQEVVDVLLYHTRALNSPALASLSEIGTTQANPTVHTLDVTTRLLNYCATYPKPTLRFVASDMILRVFSDASYLSVSKYRS